VKELKRSVVYKIEDDVLESFNIIDKDNDLNKSQWIERKIKEYLEEATANDKLFYVSQLETKNKEK